MGDGMLSLSWNNHKATFCHILTTLREKEKYTDVTVACEGRFYPVHKLVLSTCSEYFEKIFDNTPCKHPVIVLKDIAYDELEALLSYMYDGVVSVAQNDLARLIKAAEVLRIKGLAVPDEPPPSKTDVKKSTQRTPSDDRSSPHPKRRRRDDNVQSSAPSPPSSPFRDSESRTHTDTRWQDPSRDDSADRVPDNRLHQSASGATSSSSPIEVMVDETLVKEEVEDTVDNRDDGLESGMDYGSLGSDSRLDDSVGETDNQVLPNKFEDKLETPSSEAQPLPDAVVEALAGPSGMQGWLGGCEVPGGFSGMEGYSGDSSQDVHPPQQGQQSGAHQMVVYPLVDPLAVGYEWGDGIETVNTSKTLQCSFCSYRTSEPGNLKRHTYRHTGEKHFKCEVCSYQSSRKDTLKEHMATHSGEKPYACSHCSYKSSLRKSLLSHFRKQHQGSSVSSFIH